MSEERRIEIDAPARERSILVLQGPPISAAQAEHVREQLTQALDEDRWPIVLNYNGTVYWVPVGAPEEDS